MSKQTFDTVTRNIRASEAEAQVVISRVNSIVNGARRQRKLSVSANKAVFDSLSECLQKTNSLHDVVVANAHLVADNIAARSRRNVLQVRENLLAAANKMLELCSLVGLPEGIYNPENAFNRITDALTKDGLLLDDPNKMQVAIDEQRAVYVISYNLISMTISIVVSVEVADVQQLGKNGGVISVSVWEDRLPPIWDTSYHDAAGVMMPVGNSKKLGNWTKQTDSALVDYVASVLSNTVKIRTENSPPIVPATPAERTNKYSTFLGRPAKHGSSNFDYQTQIEVMHNAIEGMTVGKQGELILRLNPAIISKASLARYILGIIQSFTPQDLGGSVNFNKDGYYEISFPSESKFGQIVLDALSGKSEV